MSNYGTEAGGGNTKFFLVRLTKDEKTNKPKAVLALKCKEGVPGAKPVFKKDGSKALDKDGNHVHRLEFDFIRGKLVRLEERKNIEIQPGVFKDYLNAHMIAPDGEQLALSLDVGDNYWVDFLQRLLNVDLALPVYVRPYAIEDRQTKKVNRVLMLKQNPSSSDGQKIEKYWNKENNYLKGTSDELPAGVQKEDPKTGKMVWSFLDRDRALVKRVQVLIAAELEAAYGGGQTQQTQQPVTYTTSEEAQAAAEVEAEPAAAAGTEAWAEATDDDLCPF